MRKYTSTQKIFTFTAMPNKLNIRTNSYQYDYSLGLTLLKLNESTQITTKDKSDLYYYSAKYYAPRICKFMNVEPMKEKRTWITPYNYCQNNPVKYVDPDGREIFIVNKNASSEQQKKNIK